MTTARVPGWRWTRVLHGSCTAFVALFASWTVVSNLVVLAGGSFENLVAWLPIVPVAAGVAIYWLWRSPRTGDPEHRPRDEARGSSWLPNRGGVLLMAVGAIAAAFSFGGWFSVFWGLAVAFLGFSYLRLMLTQHGRPDEPIRLASSRGPLILAVVVAALSAVVLNRTNVDQTININMAVSVLDNPSAAIFRSDTLHGIPGAYFIPSYRVHAFELLGAWMTRALGLSEPIVVFHLLLAPVLAVLSVFAAALLFQRLVPHAWGWATLALTAILLVFRQTHTMYGNLAYVRLFEGKGVFVTLMVPLILWLALEFFDHPSGRSWTLLALAQIGAVGMTANALYAAPMAAALGLGGLWKPTVGSTRKLALGLSASAYPVGMGLVVRSAFLREHLASGLEQFQGLMTADLALRNSLGTGPTLWLWLVVLIGAWAVALNPTTRRWMLGAGFAFTLLCLNPALTDFWGRNVTGPYLTWRLLWAIPLPVFLTVFALDGLRTGPGRRGAQVLTALALAFTLIWGRPWSEPATTVVRWGLKVPEVEYAVASQLSRIAGEGQPVLAPETVSAWVPTFRHHAYPLVARRHYTEAILSVFGDRIDSAEVRERLVLHDLINGTGNPSESLPLLRQWVAQGRILGVAVPLDHSQWASISAVLTEAGFMQQELRGFSLFYRKP